MKLFMAVRKELDLLQMKNVSNVVVQAQLLNQILKHVISVKDKEEYLYVNKQSSVHQQFKQLVQTVMVRVRL